MHAKNCWKTPKPSDFLQPFKLGPKMAKTRKFALIKKLPNSKTKEDSQLKFGRDYENTFKNDW